MRFVFWLNMPGPHLMPIIDCIKKVREEVEVVVVVETLLPDARKSLGWASPRFHNIQIVTSPDDTLVADILKKDSQSTWHFFAGIKAYRLVTKAFNLSKSLALKRILITEPFNISKGRKISRVVYYFLFERKLLKYFNGILAISTIAVNWYKKLGISPRIVFFFWYAVPYFNKTFALERSISFKLLYVGQLIDRKRVDLLIKSLRILTQERKMNITLDIYGDGNLKSELLELTKKLHLERIVTFEGVRSIEKIRDVYFRYDLLVLPSQHDGWGAVVNEALLCGVPVLCSESCGSKDMVLASKAGGTFKTDSLKDLTKNLSTIVSSGRLPESSRNEIINWSKRNITPEYAATHLLKVIDYLNNGSQNYPKFPWDGPILSK